MNPRTKTLVIILITFLLGGVGGTFIGMRFLGNRGPRHYPAREEIRKEFAEKLQLTPIQTAQVDSILESYRPGFNELRQSYSQVFKARRDSMRTEIRKLLLEEQNRRYDDYIKELEDREKKRRGDR